MSELTDSILTDYINKIANIPTLTKEEQHQIFENLTKQNIDRLVNSNLKMVVNIVKKMMPVDSTETAMMDAIQEGNLGLLQAVKTFKVSKDTKFTTHAHYWIECYVRKEIANQRCGLIKKPAQVISAFDAITKVENRLEIILGHTPSCEEIEIALDGVFSKEKIAELISLKNSQMISLNTTYGEDGDDDESTLEDYVADDKIESPDKATDRKTVMEVLNKVLSEKQKFVILARFGFGKFRGKTLSLKEVGELFVEEGLADKPVSAERVRQLETSAIEKLRGNPVLKDLYADM